MHRLLPPTPHSPIYLPLLFFFVVKAAQEKRGRSFFSLPSFCFLLSASRLLQTNSLSHRCLCLLRRARRTRSRKNPTCRRRPPNHDRRPRLLRFLPKMRAEKAKKSSGDTPLSTFSDNLPMLLIIVVCFLNVLYSIHGFIVVPLCM